MVVTSCLACSLGRAQSAAFPIAVIATERAIDSTDAATIASLLSAVRDRV